MNAKNLALTYKELGRYEEALPHYIQTMAIYERAMGPDHPGFNISINNLAGFDSSQGNYDSLTTKTFIGRRSAIPALHWDPAAAILWHRQQRRLEKVTYARAM